MIPIYIAMVGVILFFTHIQQLYRKYLMMMILTLMIHHMELAEMSIR